jgi:two-component system response regulator RegX3
MPMKVLIVEDQPEIADDLSNGLGNQGFNTVTAHTGQAALEQYLDADAILLDLGLPDRDGLEVCRTIRASSNVPIILVSARHDEFDRVLGLRMGADDYVTKPYGLRELGARLEAVMRRTVDTHFRPEKPKVRRTGMVSINLHRHRVTVGDREIFLTRKEFDLLVLLTSDPGRVFDRETIMCEVWGHPSAGDTRTLGVHMVSLRRKLGISHLIETVRGVGFRFVS